MTDEKPKLSRDILESHSIFYEDDPWSPGDGSIPAGTLPDYVQVLREALLNFDKKIPDGWRMDLEKEGGELGNDEYSVPPESAYFQPLRYSTRKSTVEGIEINDCIRILDEFKDGIKEWTEDDVTHFLRINIFKRYEDTYLNRTSYNNLFDRWSIGANIHWGAMKWRPEFNPSSRVPTGPKPDLTYGFPIIASESNLPRGFHQETSAKSFSLEVHEQLCKTDLIATTVTTGLQRKKTEKLSAADLLCFPWAIVEVKRFHARADATEFCYCQAANGSSAALSLQCRLEEASGIPVDPNPIIAFTSVGADLRVWLTFLARNGDDIHGHKMVCIWEAKLDTMWGFLSTLIIVGNMHVWASRILRARISACISQVRHRLNPERPQTPTLSPNPDSYSSPLNYSTAASRRTLYFSPRTTHAERNASPPSGNDDQEPPSPSRINASENTQNSNLLPWQSCLAHRDLDCDHSPCGYDGTSNKWRRYHVYILSERRTRLCGSEDSETDSADEEYESSDYSDSQGSSEWTSNFGSEYHDCLEYIDEISSERSLDESNDSDSFSLGSGNEKTSYTHDDDDASSVRSLSRMENTASHTDSLNSAECRSGELLKQEDIDFWTTWAIEGLSGQSFAELGSVSSAIRQATAEQLFEAFRQSAIQWCNSCSCVHAEVSSPTSDVSPGALSSASPGACRWIGWDQYRKKKNMAWRILEDREWANNFFIGILRSTCAEDAMKVLNPVLNDETRNIVKEEAFQKLNSFLDSQPYKYQTESDSD